MSANYQAYKVVKGDGNAHVPENSFIAAVQAAFNAIGDSSLNAWAPGLIFDPAKIQQTGAASGDWLAWSGAAWDNATPPATTISVISDTTLSANAANFDITGISGSFKHLLVVGYLRTDRASTDDQLGVRFNADTGSNYDSYDVVSKNVGPSFTPAEYFANSSARFDNSICADNAPAHTFSTVVLVIPHYAGAANNKLFDFTSTIKTGTTNTNVRVAQGLGAWRSNSAITQVTLLPIAGTVFKSGSRVTLFGY